MNVRVRYSKLISTLSAASLFALLCGCGTQPAPIATPIPPGSSAPATARSIPPIARTPSAAVFAPATATSQEAMTLLYKAQAAMLQAKSYHVTQEMFGIYDGRVGTFEGDISNADREVRIKTDNQIFGRGEILIFEGGNDVYSKFPGDSGYIAHGSTDNIRPGAITLFLDPLQFSGFPRITRDAQIAGEEKLNGTETIKVTYTTHEDFPNLRGNELPPVPTQTSAPGELPLPTEPPVVVPAHPQWLPTIDVSGPAGNDPTYEVWVEKGTNYIVMFRELKRYDPKEFPGVAVSLKTGGAGGADTGSVVWPMTWIFSKFDQEIVPPIEKPTNIMPTPTEGVTP